MGMFGPGKEGWLAEAEMLSWAFRHLKAEERDYLTKRLKHVLGKRTLKGSWFEKDKSLVEMLVAGPAHRAGLGSLPLMTAANTEKMHALDYPGLSEDKTPEAFFRRVEAAATHEKSKEAMRAFHEEIDGTPYDRRAFAMLIIYICGFGLSWYAKAFLERYCREFGANSQTTLSISFDPSLYEGKDGDPEGEEASAGEKSEKPSQEQAPAEAVAAGHHDAAHRLVLQMLLHLHGAARTVCLHGQRFIDGGQAPLREMYVDHGTGNARDGSLFH